MMTNVLHCPMNLNFLSREKLSRNRGFFPEGCFFFSLILQLCIKKDYYTFAYSLHIFSLQVNRSSISACSETIDMDNHISSYEASLNVNNNQTIHDTHMMSTEYSSPFSSRF